MHTVIPHSPSLCLAGDLLSKTSVSFENRRKQATAIVMLGVIGAEFGQEIEPSRRKVDEGKKAKSGKSQEGFNLANYSLSRQTSQCFIPPLFYT